MVSVIVSAITDSSCLWQGSWRGVGTGGSREMQQGKRGCWPCSDMAAGSAPAAGREARPTRRCGRSPRAGGPEPQLHRPPRGIGGWVGDTDGHRPQRCPGVGTRSVPTGPALRPHPVGCRIRKAPHPLPDTGTPDAAVCPPFPEAPVCVSSSGPHPGPHQTRTDGLVGSLPSVSA